MRKREWESAGCKERELNRHKAGKGKKKDHSLLNAVFILQAYSNFDIHCVKTHMFISSGFVRDILEMCHNNMITYYLNEQNAKIISSNLESCLVQLYGSMVEQFLAVGLVG